MRSPKALTVFIATHQAALMKWAKSHSFKFLELLCILFLTMIATGCVSLGAKPKFTDAHSPRYAQVASSVELLSGKPSRDYREVGVVESSRAKKLTPDVTAQMMKDLQNKAALLGADAVIDVHRLADRHEGFVNNPRTPFPSVMQGEWKTYFFRGTAVRFVKQ
ncbi:MAG: hypothetical protein N2Z21_03120 [Candidatus Sumerlaeaceae bacterium]|nr:hypothetical protein [Candidatus Sumerlaeaceae bacterium]